MKHFFVNGTIAEQNNSIIVKTFTMKADFDANEELLYPNDRIKEAFKIIRKAFNACIRCKLDPKNITQVVHFRY